MDFCNSFHRIEEKRIHLNYFFLKASFHRCTIFMYNFVFTASNDHLDFRRILFCFFVFYLLDSKNWNVASFRFFSLCCKLKRHYSEQYNTWYL